MKKNINNMHKFRNIMHNENVNKITKNSSWLVIDKALTMIIGVFVTAIVARYFGPEKYGQFNYALAFVSLFTAISTLGLETLTVKSIIDKKYNEGTILYTSLLLRIFGGTILTILASIIIRIINPHESNIHILVIIMSFTMVLKSFEVIEYWIQAYQKAKISSLIRITVYVIISGLKILIVFMEGSIIQYSIIYIIDALFVGVALIISYFKFREEKSPWKFRKEYAKNILSQSWYLVLSGLLITLYMRIDQVMLGAMLNSKEVGIYSAAVRIAEMWYFIPLAVITSFKPVIMKNKQLNKIKYLYSMQLLYEVILLIGILFGILITFFSDYIVNILYGSQYYESIRILSINVWAGTFATLGSARSIWLISEGLQKYTIAYTFAGLLINVILNLFFIPSMGGYGAAIATLLAQITNILVLFLFKRTRISTYMIINAFLPITIIKKLKRSKDKMV